MDFTDWKYLIRQQVEIWKPAAPSEGKDWYYFLHIPKTAGTSFRYTLYDQFPAAQTYPNAVEYYLRQKARYIPLAQFRKQPNYFFPDSKKLLIGHYRMFPNQNVRETPPAVITFFRKPVDRYLSSLHYHYQKGRRYEGLPFGAISERHRIGEGSQHARSLGFLPARDNFSQAFENLEKIDGIGLLEYYQASITLFNRKFGWSLKPMWKNVAKKGKRMQLSKRDLEAIEGYCALDNALYERAKQRFFEACEQYGVALEKK